MKTLTQSQYSAYCGKSQGYISKLIKRGMPTVKVGKKRRIDPIEADKWRSKNINAQDVDQIGKADGGNERTVSAEEKKEVIEKSGLTIFKNVTEAQALDRSYAAALKKLEFEEKSGELISAEDVKRDAERAARIVKDLVTSWPGRTAPIVAPITDVFEVEQALKRECDQLLNEIADKFIS